MNMSELQAAACVRCLMGIVCVCVRVTVCKLIRSVQQCVYECLQVGVIYHFKRSFRLET